jgi:hypothetical protein
MYTLDSPEEEEKEKVECIPKIMLQNFCNLRNGRIQDKELQQR